jgi:16S rRNA (guanine966-N2)-methyltransferase
VNGTHGRSELRIIGGQWRSRKLPFAAFAGVRPTPDRVRETLFNWLQGVIPSARCLDLYAGSGALGFEALSRGAESVVLVDQDVRVIQQLQSNIERLGARGAQVIWKNALEFIPEWQGAPFEVVFLDPPYRDQALALCCQKLEDVRALTSPAWIYMEDARGAAEPPIPDNWRYLHRKHAGQINYYLARREER